MARVVWTCNPPRRRLGRFERRIDGDVIVVGEDGERFAIASGFVVVLDEGEAA